SGRSMWSLTDLDRLSAHYGVAVPDLLCGMDHAVNKLSPRRRTALVGGTQTVISAGGGAG
ncbi:acyltransferase, partial [Streptomyces sp. H39-C1]|nr:acyltransferase [Streptomyces sp. H39-C1]